MKINPLVVSRLQEMHIDKDAGLLVLLGYYYELDVDKACIEEAVKAVNLTGIVGKNYGEGGRPTQTLVWNMPLFVDGQQEVIGDWRWVTDWMRPFGLLNLDRLGNWEDVQHRFEKFFAEHPGFSVEEIFEARDMYLKTITNPTYLMKSHKFIYEGIGKMQTSNLLAYLRMVRDKKKEEETGQADIGMGKTMIRRRSE